ncbi:hypothetical protein R50345_25175 [Paenibacillus sp. FSL R5-0345]|uniref:hypothetical protein n=1 Tax=Paenibacillus sp. FSL R5-0345 TaxID=1536770 RepID=UPI0004F78A4A|nr:hypothetical protein [Paenibacillus sp. FSL R5-0345]AIQ37630.1 hypothetical protein R50345_25175 [Paenibacillus sp. FSL R5-0345]
MQFYFEEDNNQIEIKNPQFENVKSYLGEMDGKTASYCTYELNDIHYVQCAGSKNGMTIEFRKQTDNGFRHFVLGYKSLIKTKIELPYSGGKIQVRSNEVISVADAKEVFFTFHSDQKVPEGFVLRETTEMFY